MLNRAAFFATMFAGAGLTVAVLLGQTGAVAAEPQTSAPIQQVEVLEHATVGWHLVYEGDRAKLAYGIADTDQILVMFSCGAGDRTVQVFGQVTPDTESVRLTSASLMSDVAVEAEVDPLSGAMVAETEMPVRSSALQGFRDSGRLTLAAAGGREVPAHALQAEQADVRAFFDHCDRRSI